MKKWLLSILAACFLSACPSPTPTPNPSGAGGSISTGGSSAQGGETGTGGSQSPCANIAWPTYDNLMFAKKVEHHKFTKRHFRPKIRGLGAAMGAHQTSACSQWRQRNVPQFDQGPVGSCTGNAGVGSICTEPFATPSYCNEDGAIQAYQGGTCVDNGCSLSKCSCSGCPKAYCPNTGANDNGSFGSSVYTWMKAKGWLYDFDTADTQLDLSAGIEKTACIIGINYYYSMESIGPDCRAVVKTSSGLAGGHEIEVVGKQVMPDGSIRWWFVNSWGIWGCKDAKGYYGYAWISNEDLFGNVLQMDGDCPILKP